MTVQTGSGIELKNVRLYYDNVLFFCKTKLMLYRCNSSGYCLRICLRSYDHPCARKRRQDKIVWFESGVAVRLI